MSVASEVMAAVRRILECDDSAVAAALEKAHHAYHPYEEEFEDLLEALALYTPAMGSPHTDHRQLTNAIRESPIGDLGGDGG